MEHTKVFSKHSKGIIDLHNNTKDGDLDSMTNIVPSEPGNERNMCSKENVVLCDKCCVGNVKFSQLCSNGMGSRMQSTQLDYVPSSMSDSRGILQEDYSLCTRRHGIHSSRGDFSKCICDKWRQMQEDYSECTGSHEADSTKCHLDLPNTCRITGKQSQSSLSKGFLCPTRCSETRSLTDSKPNVINHRKTQKEMDSIPHTFHKRKEGFPADTLPHSSPTVPCKQRDSFTNSKHSKSDDLIVFQQLDTQEFSQKTQDFTEKIPDKLPFQVPTKCSSAIPKCIPRTSQYTVVTSFQDRISTEEKSLPSQCNSAGTNTALYLYHSAVTLLKRTRSPYVFTNSLLILLCMLSLLPLPTHSATNGIPCLYKGSLKSDRSWFGFLTNITIMNTGRMTFQFSYPAEKCCQNILFYLEDQVSILNARMNCWQKESLLRPEDDQILRLTPRFSWSGCHLSHPNGFVGIF